MGAENSLCSPDIICNIYRELGAQISIVRTPNTDDIIIHMNYRGKELEQQLTGLEYRINQITFFNTIDEMYQKLKIADTIAKKMLGEDNYEYRIHYEGTLMYNPNHNKIIIEYESGDK